jgi:hypothetical protein
MQLVKISINGKDKRILNLSSILSSDNDYQRRSTQYLINMDDVVVHIHGNNNTTY